ncbi:hypothetical protein, partial [Alloalcanivorax profundimaris]|uniref:hypothetical protein n=1 Tax=Alloalcanivorax profundimaris TaxID=2735259 RepID=UPI001E364EB7
GSVPRGSVVGRWRLDVAPTVSTCLPTFSVCLFVAQAFFLFVIDIGAFQGACALSGCVFARILCGLCPEGARSLGL